QPCRPGLPSQVPGQWPRPPRRRSPGVRTRAPSRREGKSQSSLSPTRDADRASASERISQKKVRASRTFFAPAATPRRTYWKGALTKVRGTRKRGTDFTKILRGQ